MGRLRIVTSWRWSAFLRDLSWWLYRTAPAWQMLMLVVELPWLVATAVYRKVLH